MRPARLILAAVAVIGALTAAAPAHAETCPDVRFLTVDGRIYRGEALAEPSAVTAGGPVGEATLDASAGDDRCDRATSQVQAVTLAGIDPAVAVGVDGRSDWIYVLGYRCDGLPGPERPACLGEPLLLDGRAYYARRYPAGDGERRAFTGGALAGEGTVGGESVEALAIDGVDPRVAVVVAGTPDRAYVASESCLFVAADADRELDGFGRCLTSPVWLLFEPPLEEAGKTVRGRSDRPVEASFDGATVALVEAIGGDRLPDDLSDATEIGTIRVTADGQASFAFEAPDIDGGVYESVVRCPSCGPGGVPVELPTGVFVLLASGGGVSGLAYAGIIVLFCAATGVASYVFFRRARARRDAGAGPPPQT